MGSERARWLARRLLGPLLPGWPDEGRRIVQQPHLEALLEGDPGGHRTRVVVNAGAGQGLFSPLLLAQPGVERLLDLDLSYSRHRLRPIDPRQRFIAASVTRLPIADGAADLVLCSEVLEHIEDDGAALDELARVLAPGGRLLITVPTPPAVDDPAHVREGYRPEELTASLAARGLEVRAIRFAMHGLFKLVLRRWRPGRWPRLLIQLLARLDNRWRLGPPQDLLLLARRPAAVPVPIVIPCSPSRSR